MAYRKRGPQHVLVINDDPPMNKFKPSVDYFFNSLGKNSCDHIVSVMLTGMGKDGSLGMKKLKEMGASTIAQDQNSSAVYGMPRAAVELGIVDDIKDINEIADTICSHLAIKTSNQSGVA